MTTWNIIFLFLDGATSSSCSIGGVTSPPTTVSLLQVIEQNKRLQQQKIDVEVNNTDNKQTTENEQQKQKNISGETAENEPCISEERKEDVALSQSKNTQSAKYLRNNKKSTTDNLETKQMVEKLLAAKEEIARRHAETIGLYSRALERRIWINKTN